MIKACIFDLDGVIVDTARYHYKAWKRLANHLGIDFSEEQNEAMKGISRMASLDHLLSLGNKSLSKDEKIKYCGIKNLWYLDYVSEIDSSAILPGVSEFLIQLKEKEIKIGLGSASKNAKTIIDLINLKETFEVIVDGNMVSRSKPDPEVFTSGAEALGVMPSQTVVFEDSAKGIDAALAGGFYAIGVGSPDHLSHAHSVIEGFERVRMEYINEQLFTKAVC